MGRARSQVLRKERPREEEIDKLLVSDQLFRICFLLGASRSTPPDAMLSGCCVRHLPFLDESAFRREEHDGVCKYFATTPALVGIIRHSCIVRQQKTATKKMAGKWLDVCCMRAVYVHSLRRATTFLQCEGCLLTVQVRGEIAGWDALLASWPRRMRLKWQVSG